MTVSLGFLGVCVAMLIVGTCRRKRMAGDWTLPKTDDVFHVAWGTVSLLSGAMMLYLGTQEKADLTMLSSTERTFMFIGSGLLVFIESTRALGPRVWPRRVLVEPRGDGPAANGVVQVQAREDERV